MSTRGVSERDEPQDGMVSRRWFLDRMAWVSSVAAAGAVLPSEVGALGAGRGDAARLTTDVSNLPVRAGVQQEPTEMTLAETIALVRRGAVRPEEMVEAYSDRIGRFDGVLLEGLANDTSEMPWQVVVQLGDRRRVIPDDRGHHRQLGVAAERPTPGRHLVEQDAERENVGAVIDRLTFRLFRRHVGYRAQNPAFLSCRAGGKFTGTLLGKLLLQLRQAEV